MCSFRDGWSDLAKLNAKLFGISGDYVFTHHEWAKAHKLTNALLQDHDHVVAKAYASFSPQLQGLAKRTVYLIDKNGIVRYRNLKFRAGAKEDYEALRAELMKLQEQPSK
jgi:glutaredoxin-dependent peroxiredoxin